MLLSASLWASRAGIRCPSLWPAHDATHRKWLAACSPPHGPFKPSFKHTNLKLAFFFFKKELFVLYFTTRISWINFRFLLLKHFKCIDK